MATRPPVRSPRTSKARKPRAGSAAEPLDSTTQPPTSEAARPGAALDSLHDSSDVELTAVSLERREITSASLSRETRIAIAAYWRAQRRGFEAGRELDDWLEAEREIDSELAREAAESGAGSRENV